MPDPKKNIRNSTAEYLTFLAAGGKSESSMEIRYEEENIWLTQKLMAELYGVTVPAINQHLKRLFSDSELEPEATIKKFLIVQMEGKREVQRSVDHYNLQATQFRWHTPVHLPDPRQRHGNHPVYGPHDGPDRKINQPSVAMNQTANK